MAEYLLKGIIIGLIFGVPVGAVGAMTLQRTLKFGVKQGLLTGLGSSAADCIYACAGVFGITLISDFLAKYKTIINIIGGGFVILMGIDIVRKKQTKTVNDDNKGGLKMFISSFTIGITNPAAVLTFLFAFSYFNIPSNAGIFCGMSLVVGVFLGTYFWWGLLTFIADILKKNVRQNFLDRLNIIFGCILVLFGAAVLIKTAVEN